MQRKSWQLFSLFVFVPFFLQADIASGVLSKYPHAVFVGTGIRSGVNVARAIHEGFLKIYVIDKEKVFVEHIQVILPQILKEARRTPTVFIAEHKDPKTSLKQIIKNIKEPVTFLLSSYLPDPDYTDNVSSIFEELEQIQAHPIKTHTILIEYIRHAGTPGFKATREALKAKILEINPKYQFRLEQGGHLEHEKEAILAAYLP